MEINFRILVHSSDIYIFYEEINSAELVKNLIFGKKMAYLIICYFAINYFASHFCILKFQLICLWNI